MQHDNSKQMPISVREYLNDPCRASSLPFWKSERITIPGHLSICRDDLFSADLFPGVDEPYFKLMHELRSVPTPVLPASFELADCDISAYAHHIQECYTEESISVQGLRAYQSHPVYDPSLWIVVAEVSTGRIVATGIGELDTRIGEGVLEWIQVSPDYRRRGLGRFIVCELLRRMQDRAAFVTVSGRVKNASNPYALYQACGFTNPVIWHVVTNR